MSEIEYRIVRTPNLPSVTKGAVVDYRCEGPRTDSMFGDGSRGYAESVRWFRKGEEDTSFWDGCRIDLGFGWEKKFEFDIDPGHYVVWGVVRGGLAKKGMICGPMGQYVMRNDEVDSVLATMVGEARKAGLANPNEAVVMLEKNIGNLKLIEENGVHKLTPDQKREHDAIVKKYEEYLSRLKSRLKSTDGLRRVPIFAVHIDYKTQVRRQLNFFLAYVGIKGGKQVWRMVDWTNPAKLSETSESEGKGYSPGEAIEDLFSDWDWWHGRYPPGKIMFTVPKEVCGQYVSKTIETDGKTTWDEVIGWLYAAGMVAAGVALFVTPIPGSQAASVAVWSTIFSVSTGAAAEIISISQRRSEGIYDARADAYSALSIIGNIFTAGLAKWAKGAQIIIKTEKATKAQKYLFVGSVAGEAGTEVAQGVLILDEKFSDYEKILNDPALLPDERSRKLHDLFRELALSGAMIYIGLRASKADLDGIVKNRGHMKLDGATGIPEAEVDLKRLTKTDEVIDTTKKPTTKGHPQHVETRTTANTRTRRLESVEQANKKLEESLKDDKIWRKKKITDDTILLQHPKGGNFSNAEETDWIFKAHIGSDGFVEITINTRSVKTGEKSDLLRGGEVYDFMFRHFESNGHPIKGWEGVFAWDNYAEVKKAITERNLSEKEAVLESITGKKFWKPWADRKGYEMVVEEAMDMPGVSLFMFKVRFLPK